MWLISTAIGVNLFGIDDNARGGDVEVGEISHRHPCWDPPARST
jgi:hypothetical protein